MRINSIAITKILSALLLSTTMFLCALPQAQAQLGSQMYMYSWGDASQLGRPQGGVHPPANRPGRVPTPAHISRPPNASGPYDYWISSATSSGGSLAVRADGALFALTGTGMNRIGGLYTWRTVSGRTDNRVALNNQGQLFRFTSANTPVQVQGSQNIPGTQTPQNWIYAVAGNNELLAINYQGQLWSMGTGTSVMFPQSRDALGRGLLNTFEEYQTFARVTVPPGNASCDLVWTSISVGAQFVVGVTECNRLWTWGDTGHGRLGRDWGASAPHNVPGQVGAATNWVAVGSVNFTAAAINENGHLYTWGDNNADGRIGRTVDAANPHTEPGRVALTEHGGTNPARFVSIHGGNGHFLAFTEQYRLYSWGSNTGGQLGRDVGGASPQNRPHLVVQTYGFSDAARGGGSTSIMLMRTTPAEGDLYIEKNVRKLQAAPRPTLEFEFEFERHSFNGNIAQANLLPNIPNLTVEIDNTSDSSTAGGITTLSSQENALAGISFAEVGVFAYMITEVEDSSGINTIPPGVRRVNYSQAKYEARIDVRQIAGPGSDFYIHDVTLLRHRTADGTAVVPPEPVTGFDNTVFFTNDYRRFSLGTNTCAGALTVSKEIDGDFVDPATPFTFEVTLTGTALCAAGTEFSARVYGPNNNFIRTESFEVGETEDIILLDEQTLVFPYLPVGLQWEVEELELLEFTAALELTVNGVTNPRVTNPNPQLDLSTGTHTITAENLRNSAHFINIHFITPPMGLMIGNGAAYLVVAAAGFMLVTLLVLKARRRAEEGNTELERLDLFKT